MLFPFDIGGGKPNISTVADIVFAGAAHVPIAPAASGSLGHAAAVILAKNEYYSSGVVIQANFLSPLPGGTAIHLGAVREAVITGNVRGGSQCANASADNALVTVGSDPQYFVAEDVTMERNRRWTTALSIHARIETSRDNGINLHTFRSSAQKQRNYARECCRWASVPDLPHIAMPTLQPDGSYSGLPCLRWTTPKGNTTSAAVAWQTNLENSPGLAGQVVWFAVQVSPISLACAVNGSIGLAIDPGNGKWQYSCEDEAAPDRSAYPEAAQPRGCLRLQTQASGQAYHARRPPVEDGAGSATSMPWNLLSFQATMRSSGEARFGVRVDNAAEEPSLSDGSGCAIQLRVLAGQAAGEESTGSVAIAPVGVDYNSV
eukprot:SAG22_NODE_698_length_7809_cov_2.743061_4_plen_375_part_00